MQNLVYEEKCFKDDDVRVPFGKAHDNARQIVEEHNALETLNEAIKGIPNLNS